MKYWILECMVFLFSSMPSLNCYCEISEFVDNFGVKYLSSSPFFGFKNWNVKESAAGVRITAWSSLQLRTTMYDIVCPLLLLYTQLLKFYSHEQLLVCCCLLTFSSFYISILHLCLNIRIRKNERLLLNVEATMLHGFAASIMLMGKSQVSNNCWRNSFFLLYFDEKFKNSFLSFRILSH